MPHTTISGEYDLGYDSDLEPVKEHLKRHPDEAKHLIHEAESHHHAYFRYKGEKYKISHEDGHHFRLKEDTY
jgi:hypothetical protein